jgi:HSP20 family protein
MLLHSMYPRDLFAEIDRLQRELLETFDLSPSIRGIGRGFPALNVGSTPRSIELYAFAPGLDPATLHVQLERGVLTLSGERKATPVPEGATVHVEERFIGAFRRVITLPDDIDPAAVAATYRDGVLHVSIGRKAEAQPRRIEIQ